MSDIKTKHESHLDRQSGTIRRARAALPKRSAAGTRALAHVTPSFLGGLQ